MGPARRLVGASWLEPDGDQDHPLSRPSPRDNGECSGFGPLSLRSRLRHRETAAGSVPVWWDGPCLESRFDFKSTRKVAKIATIALDFSASTFVFGLGYSFVEIREHSVGMDMRLWVLATPVDGTLIDLTLVSQSRRFATRSGAS